MLPFTFQVNYKYCYNKLTTDFIVHPDVGNTVVNNTFAPLNEAVK